MGSTGLDGFYAKFARETHLFFPKVDLWSHHCQSVLAFLTASTHSISEHLVSFLQGVKSDQAFGSDRVLFAW